MASSEARAALKSLVAIERDTVREIIGPANCVSCSKTLVPPATLRNGGQAVGGRYGCRGLRGACSFIMVIARQAEKFPGKERKRRLRDGGRDELKARPR